MFALDDGGQSLVVDQAGDTEDRVLNVAEQCPMSAITVEDAETGTRLFPPPD